MIITAVRDLKYSKEDLSSIDLFVTCKEYGEVPTTLNMVDTEDLHLFATGTFKTVIIDNVEVEEEILIPLEEYCKTLEIADYSKPIITEEQRIASIKVKANEIIETQYPLFKQLNLIRLGGVKLEVMTVFIDRIRAISNLAETNKTPVEQINWEIK